MKQLLRDAKAIGIGRAISCAAVGKYYGYKGKVAEIKAKVKSVIKHWNMEEAEETE